jgi:glycoprotein-N-acetylgalactosamine 3-beta-galactosyltransferase
LILTSPQYFLTRTKAVNATWGPRCDRYFFITEYPGNNMTSEQINFAKQIPIASIKNIRAGYDHLTQKSTLAFLFAHEKYFNDFDWFVKADDDTYLIVENLKSFLSEKNSAEPFTFGYDFKVNINDPSLCVRLDRLSYFVYFS